MVPDLEDLILLRLAHTDLTESELIEELVEVWDVSVLKARSTLIEMERTRLIVRSPGGMLSPQTRSIN